MKLFKSAGKKLMLGLAFIAAVSSFGIAASASFGPDRQTLAYSPTMRGFDHPQFNSITGVPNGVGDERDFFRGYVVGRDSQWTDPVNDVTQDAEVEAKIYIHNNADIEYNSGDKKGVAKNVTVKVDMPTSAKQSQELKASISADNAQPQMVFDTLNLTGLNAGFFELEPIAGSGKLVKDGQVIGAVDVNQLISGSGVNIGDQDGCFQAVREVVFRMKVKMPHYTVSKLVRLDGQTKNDWKESITTTPGQLVEYKIEFDNIGRTLLKNVTIVDDLPAGMVVEPGTVRLIDGNFPTGTSFGADAIQKNGTQINVMIGNVNAGINSIVTFKARVPALDKLTCGENSFVNKAYSTPEGYHTIMDAATVTTTGKTCVTETTSYKCEDVKIEKLGARKVRVSVTAKGTPANRVSIKNYEYNYGDGKTPLVTDKNSTEYTYDKDGTYKVSVKTNFVVDGKDQAVAGAECEEVVTFTTTPTTLPNTGAGSTIGMFLISTVIGFVIYRAYAMRKV